MVMLTFTRRDLIYCESIGTCMMSDSVIPQKFLQNSTLAVLVTPTIYKDKKYQHSIPVYSSFKICEE